MSQILEALYRGDAETAQLHATVTPDMDQFEAAAIGNADRLAELLDRDPAAKDRFAPDGFTALQLAAFFGRVDATQVLLDHGADPSPVARNDMKVQALHSATAGRHHEVVELLLAAGADVNARQQGGWTPLMQAAHHGDMELVDMMLAYGADPTATVDDGRDAAALAAEGGHDAVAEILRTP
ncbi:MAG TPA: ankyrin repeat domain-containing protein [Acidimicrobiales bacterium]|nr:ankyrin repeat domain-containing protein [Acidimicrobiales bacterium]